MNNDVAVVDTRQAVSRLLRHRLIIALAVLLGACGGIALSQVSDPQYQAHADILIGRRATEQITVDVPIPNADPARVNSTNVALLTSDHVSTMVEERLGKRYAVSAGEVPNTSLIRVNVRDVDAKAAADAANAYVDAYLEMLKRQESLDLDTAEKALRESLKSYQSQLQAANVNSVNASVLENHIASIQTTLDRISTARALGPVSAQRASTASPPSNPAGSGTIKNGLFGAIFGGFVGLGVAWIREQRSRKVMSPSELSDALPTAHVVGTVATKADPSAFERLRGIVELSRSSNESGVERPLVALITSVDPPASRTVIKELQKRFQRSGTSVEIVGLAGEGTPAFDQLEAAIETTRASVLLATGISVTRDGQIATLATLADVTVVGFPTTGISEPELQIIREMLSEARKIAVVLIAPKAMASTN